MTFDGPMAEPPPRNENEPVGSAPHSRHIQYTDHNNKAFETDLSRARYIDRVGPPNQPVELWHLPEGLWLRIPPNGNGDNFRPRAR
jgi:hypothetical protein